MMAKKDEQIKLISAGLSSEMAKKATKKGYTLEKLSTLSQKKLAQVFGYVEEGTVEGSSVSEAVKRKPISSEIVKRLVLESDWKCCMCWDISKETPVIIHHINLHSKTNDDSYENLVVLCPNHHALAHSNWEISRHPLPPELLKERKNNWTQAIAEFKKGLRPAPTKESPNQDVFGQSDKDTLNRLRMFLDRPAIHQPFELEGNMADFLKAITDIIRALNTGILRTREGVEICRTKPRSMLSNPRWMEKLELITSRFEDIRTRFEIAVRNNELIFRADGFYAFNNRELPNEIDLMRESIILMFNNLLQEAGLPPMKGIRNSIISRRFW